MPRGTSYYGTGRTRRGRTVTGTSFTTVRNNLQNKIQSFQTLWRQTQGKGSNRPSPATINRFASLVSKGAVIYTVSPTKISKFAKATGKSINWKTRSPSAAAATKVLKAKFGGAVKGVFRGVDGKFVVAAAPQWKGKPFKPNF